MAEEEEGDAPRPETEGDENPEDDEEGDLTVFRNLYTTKILPPYEEEVEETAKERRSPRDYTIALTDENADEYGDTTRVGWKGRVDYALQELEEEKQRAIACHNEAFRDPNRLLEVAVSTIILMASGSAEVPMENYLYTELYLKNIKDENGDHPPNISNLLKHMRFLKKQYDIKWQEEYRAIPPENLVVTKITKRSKIPVKINRTVITTTAKVNLEDEGEGGYELAAAEQE